jgi:hypothetical protein
MPKYAQHLANFAPLNHGPLSIRTHLGTLNQKIMLCRNLTAASSMMFTTDITFIYLVKVAMVRKRNMYPPGALGSIRMM